MLPRVDRQIPDDSPLWDALDAIVHADAAGGAEDQEAGVVRIPHGPLTRFSAGESDVSFAAIDELAANDLVTVEGKDLVGVNPTARGRYHLTKWSQRIRRGGKRAN